MRTRKRGLERALCVQAGHTLGVTPALGAAFGLREPSLLHPEKPRCWPPDSGGPEHSSISASPPPSAAAQHMLLDSLHCWSSPQLCWAAVLRARPRLIKVLGRTQRSLEPGWPDNWLLFDVFQVQNGPRPLGQCCMLVYFRRRVGFCDFPFPSGTAIIIPVITLLEMLLNALSCSIRPLLPNARRRPPTTADLPSI